MIIIGLGIGGLVAGAVIFSANNLKPKPEEKIIPTSTPTPIIEKTVWNDQSGFTFEYPKNLKLDPHDEDKTNYAHVELTDKDHPGKIIVWTKDTNASDLNSYLKLNKITTSLDTKLGGEEAKKLITGDEEKIVKVATIKDGYLYEIEYSPVDESYWNPVFDNLLTSYKFIQSEAKKNEVAPQVVSSGETPSSDFVEEEIVE